MKDFLRRSDKRRLEFGQAARRFAEEHPGSFVLLADPEMDVMYAAFGKFETGVQLTDPAKKGLIARGLRYAWRSDNQHDDFLMIVDSMLYNIAQARDTTMRKAEGGSPILGLVEVEPEITPEGIKSPLQPDR